MDQLLRPERRNVEIMKVLFIQKDILHYRVPFYNAMAALPGFKVTVAHSGGSIGSDIAFIEQPLRESCFASLRWQHDLLPLARRHDVIVATFDIHFLSSIRLTLLRNRPPLVWWGIGLGRNRHLHKLRVGLTRFAGSVVAYMPSNVRQLAEAGVARHKLFCAPNTVHVANAALKPASMQPDSFLFVGSLNPRKQVDELIQAFGEARHALPDGTILNIVGTGACETSLRAMATELGLSSHVVFHGRIEDDVRLQPLFHRAYALVSPGQIGLTILHSFAHGTAVITRQGAISGGELENLVDGENGLFYAGGSSNLAAVMIRVAGNPALALRLGANAYRHYAGTMTIDHMVQGFTAAITHALVPTAP